MLIFRKFICTVYDMRILLDSATAADIIRTKLKNNRAITGINVTVLLYNNRRGFKKVFNNNNKFKFNACFIFN